MDDELVKREIKAILRKHESIILDALCLIWDLEKEWLEFKSYPWEKKTLEEFKPRRYLETTQSFIENNRELVVEFLEMLGRDKANIEKPVEE